MGSNTSRTAVRHKQRVALNGSLSDNIDSEGETFQGDSFKNKACQNKYTFRKIRSSKPVQNVADENVESDELLRDSANNTLSLQGHHLHVLHSEELVNVCFVT